MALFLPSLYNEFTCNVSYVFQEFNDMYDLIFQKSLSIYRNPVIHSANLQPNRSKPTSRVVGPKPLQLRNSSGNKQKWKKINEMKSFNFLDTRTSHYILEEFLIFFCISAKPFKIQVQLSILYQGIWQVVISGVSAREDLWVLSTKSWSS